MKRITHVINHINPNKVAIKKDDDIVIVSCVRSAITKARKGEFANLPVEELLAPVLKAVIDQTKINLIQLVI